MYTLSERIEWKTRGGETVHLKIDLRPREPVISVDKLTAPCQARLVITADFRASCTLPIFSITGMKSPLSDRLSG